MQQYFSSLDIRYRTIIKIAIPVVFANMIMPLQGIIDTAIAGHFGQADFLAGLGIATQFMMLILVSFNFLQYATSGQTAQVSGQISHNSQNNYQQLLYLLQRAIFLALCISGLIWLIKPFLLMPILSFFSQEAQVIHIAYQYTSIRIWGLPFELINYVCLGWFAGQGLGRYIFWQQLAIAITNLIISLALVYIWQWQMLGLAIGTVFGYFIGNLVSLWLVSSQLSIKFFQLFPPRYQWKNFHYQQLLPLLMLNRDIFIRTLLLTLSLSWLTKLSAMQGSSILASNTLLLQVLTISAFALDGVAVATESLTGKSVAHSQQGDYRLFYTIIFRTGLISYGLAMILSLFWWFGISAFITLMTNVDNIQQIAKQYQWFAVLLPMIGVGAYWLDGIFFGLTAGRFIRNGSIIVAILFFPTSWLLVTHYDNHGLWLALYVFLLARAITLAIYLAITPLHQLLPSQFK